MKNYKGKAMVSIFLISMFFIGMYAILSITNHRAFIADGVIWKEYSLKGFANNIILGLLIALLPYELICSKISVWFCELFDDEEKKKVNIWASIILVSINIALGIFGCVVKHRTPYYLESSNRHFQYVMLFFICLCIGIIICSRRIEDKAVRFAIRTVTTVFNGFLVLYISKTMGQTIIFMIAMTGFIIVYDVIMGKKLNWKEVVATSLVGIVGTICGLLARGYHNLEELGALSRMLYSFDKVDCFLGTGYYILFIFIAVSMVAVMIFSIKTMSRVNSVRTGFLTGACALYICTFVYIFLTSFNILPCAEIQLITNRIHIVAFVLIIRCFIIIPIPKKEKIPSFIERVINSKSDEEDEEFDWIAGKIEQIMRRQNTTIEYLCVLDLKIQELINESCEDEKTKMAKLREIEDARTALKEEGVPMNMSELVEKFNKLSQKR